MNEESDSLFLTILYMVVFYFIFTLTELALIVLAVIQVLATLVAGEPNANIQRFGAQLGEYVSSIVRYLSMQCTTKPYPFSDWPNPPEQEPDQED